ncbi:hypothetical protein ACWC9T_37300, partial [Kitasatospora sp. NPDC001159]
RRTGSHRTNEPEHQSTHPDLLISTSRPPGDPQINDPDARYQDLGADWHQRHLNSARKTRDLVRQLQALGHQVTLAPTA